MKVINTFDISAVGRLLVLMVIGYSVVSVLVLTLFFHTFLKLSVYIFRNYKQKPMFLLSSTKLTFDGFGYYMNVTFGHKSFNMSGTNTSVALSIQKEDNAGKERGK